MIIIIFFFLLGVVGFIISWTFILGTIGVVIAILVRMVQNVFNWVRRGQPAKRIMDNVPRIGPNDTMESLYRENELKKKLLLNEALWRQSLTEYLRKERLYSGYGEVDHVYWGELYNAKLGPKESRKEDAEK